MAQPELTPDQTIQVEKVSLVVMDLIDSACSMLPVEARKELYRRVAKRLIGAVEGT